MLSAIVAVAHGNVIGKKNELPWYLPADLKRFRDLTRGHAVIMGRHTADSIIERNGKPLPERENIVITRDASYAPEGFTVVHSLDEALEKVKDKDAFVIGGQQIYALALPVLDRLYITEIDIDIDGDAYFPAIDTNEWQEIERESHEKDEKNLYDYTYVTLERVNAR